MKRYVFLMCNNHPIIATKIVFTQRYTKTQQSQSKNLSFEVRNNNKPE